MGNMRITANVARAIVDAGTAKNYKSTQDFKKASNQGAGNLWEEVKTAVLQGVWEWDNALKIWKNEAYFYRQSSDEPRSPKLTVFATLFPKDNAPLYVGRVLICWRGRWDVISDAPRQYVAGAGIEINAASGGSVRDQYAGEIVNAGIKDAIVRPKDSSEGVSLKDGGTIYFDDNDFTVGSRGGVIGRAPILNIAGRLYSSCAAGDGIEVTLTRSNSGSRTYTINNKYQFPGLPVTYNGNQAGLTSIQRVAITGAASDYVRSVSTSGGVLYLANPTKVEVVTNATFENGVLKVEKKTIYAYL